MEKSGGASLDIEGSLRIGVSQPVARRLYPPVPAGCPTTGFSSLAAMRISDPSIRFQGPPPVTSAGRESFVFRVPPLAVGGIPAEITLAREILNDVALVTLHLAMPPPRFHVSRCPLSTRCTGAP